MNAAHDDCVGIGEFLVNHKPGPHTERTDTIEYQDFDVRQDAVYRCLRAFTKNGVEVTDETLLNLLECDRYRYAVAQNLKNARIDARRRLHGRGSQQNKDKRRRITLRTWDHEFVWMEEDPANVENLGWCPEAERALDNVECDFHGELRRIYANATTTEQKAIRVLAEWQRRKDCGENTYPLRKTIHKLRDKLKSEGSNFDLTPRYL